MGKNSKNKSGDRKNSGAAGQNAENSGGVTAGTLNRAANKPAQPQMPRMPTSPSGPGGISAGAFVGGAACLALAVIMTVMLVIDHFGLASLPGCHEGGGCAEVTRGKWGKVPGTSYPVSFVGLAYFAGLLLAWMMSRGGVADAFRHLVRLGAVMSMMFIGLMIAEGHFCAYCFVTHLANFGFWAIVEFGRLPTAASMRGIGAVAGVFIVASGAMFAADKAHTGEISAEQDRQRQEDMQKIIAVSQQKGADGPTTVTDAGTNGASSPTGAQPVAVQPKREPFTGRYRTGPEAAPVRMLMITDYQCPDCRAVEAVARQILAERDDVSLSVKHFPMDQSCNSHMSRTLHANACWAARAAETAGLLRGSEGFWEMHHWLFDRKGAFTDAELNAGLAAFGYDPREFTQIMMSPQTLALVQEDCNEAMEVGVFFTPMIFINGVHLRGVFEANANKLRDSVNVLLAQNLPALTAEADEKPTAIETCIGDWREEFQRRLPADSTPWLRGPADARVQIVMWADYQEQWSPVADAEIRKWMEGKPDVSYAYRHFPFNQACNSVVSRTAFEQSCVAARAAEAAGQLGGIDAFWLMHEWLMTNQKAVTEQSVIAAASSMGMDGGAFAAALLDGQVAAAIEEDCKAAKPSATATFSLLYRGGIPTIYINGRAVPRWRLNQTVIIDKILDAAYEGK